MFICLLCVRDLWVHLKVQKQVSFPRAKVRFGEYWWWGVNGRIVSVSLLCLAAMWITLAVPWRLPNRVRSSALETDQVTVTGKTALLRINELLWINVTLENLIINSFVVAYHLFRGIWWSKWIPHKYSGCVSEVRGQEASSAPTNGVQSYMERNARSGSCCR